MPRHTRPSRVAELLLSSLQLQLVSCTVLQSLWAGYGQICSIQARKPGDTTTYQFILKLITPPPDSRGDEGHLRKMLSYEVEQYFYQQVAPRLGSDVRLAKCLASTPRNLGARTAEFHGMIAYLMTDLRLEFPVAGEKRGLLDARQAHAALEWLSRFHGSSWKLLLNDHERFLLPPLEEARRRADPSSVSGDKLWLNGGYTYLATRRSEYASLAENEDSEWSTAFCKPSGVSSLSVAEMVAKVLTPRGRWVETYIHGDVKSENLFASKSGDKVAFYDFQYAGLGLGVCDLAKLFTCSVPLEFLTTCNEIPHELPLDVPEKALLEYYLETLLSYRPQDKQNIQYEWDTFVRHWETALVDWCRFQASWGFWGHTEWLEARVRSILADKEWRARLAQELEFTEQ